MFIKLSYIIYVINKDIKRFDEFKDAIRLFPDHAACNNYNDEMLRNLDKPICKENAINNPSRGKSYSEDQF